MKKTTIPKGQILQSKGELRSKIYVVKSGLLRSYSIDEKGKEHIFMFAPGGWVLADNVPPDQPSELFIDALEDSEAIILLKEVDDKVDQKKLLNRVSAMQKRIIMLMSASAIERYDHFVETYPDIVQRVPQRMIASYLGITPEALSKVKGDRKRAMGNKGKS
jgi:CRP-like cAMP-binding protein